MIDFSSSLYLGMKHPSAALRPWSRVTTGIPAALWSPRGAEETANRLATLQGCERGFLGCSTLHLFWDLFGILAADRIDIFIDAATYPIARWGAERAAARGVSVQTVRHHDVNMVMEAARNSGRRGIRPVMVADGFCPACGNAAPLAEYLDALRGFGGLMILDDTQALGIFGGSPTPEARYGIGGGGILPWSTIAGPDILAVTSLAKGFGAPVAGIVGGDLWMRHFEANSETRVHCSPPSVAAIHAAEHALDLNDRHGDALRLRLARLVGYFRRRMAEAGFRFAGGLFPVQTLAVPPWLDVVCLFDCLVGLGVRPVLHRNRDHRGRYISFIVTCRHTPDEIDFAVELVTRCHAFELEPRGRRAPVTSETVLSTLDVPLLPVCRHPPGIKKIP